MMERVPESIANAIKGTGWMKVVAFLGIAGGALSVAGGVLGVFGSLIAFASLGAALGIIILAISVIALVVGSFFLYTYRMLWDAANYLEESYTSLSSLVRAINYLDRFFTFLIIYEAVRFAFSLLILIIMFVISLAVGMGSAVIKILIIMFIISLVIYLAVGMGSAVIKRPNSAKTMTMRILAVLTVINYTLPIGGNNEGVVSTTFAIVLTLLIFGPIAFFLWRAASFREKIEGEINETNAEYVAGYLTNLRWYFMLQVILPIVALVLIVLIVVGLVVVGGIS